MTKLCIISAQIRNENQLRFIQIEIEKFKRKSQILIVVFLQNFLNFDKSKRRDSNRLWTVRKTIKKKLIFASVRREDFIENDHSYLLVLLLQSEFLLLDLFQLITEIKLGGFLLELGELVLVFRHLLQGWFHARMARRHYVINCIQFLKISIKNLTRQLDIFFSYYC